MISRTGLVTRRKFVQCCRGLAIGRVGLSVIEGEDSKNLVSFSRAVREYKRTALLDVSPDGKRLCLHLGKYPSNKYTWSRGLWKAQSNGTTDKILIVDLGTWKASTSVRVLAKPLSGSFFLDSKTLYIQTFPFQGEGFIKSQQLLINSDGVLVESFLRGGPHDNMRHFQALINGQLLGDEYDVTLGATVALTLALLPEYTTTLRAPFIVVPERDRFPKQSALVISADRRSIIYAFDRWIVCRLAKDLQLIWKRQLAAPMRPWQLAISATGSRVVAAAVDTAYIADQRDFNIQVFDGRDGSSLTQLPLNGFDGIAISPSGNSVAVSRLMHPIDHQMVEPAVHVYDVPSGKEIATLRHDPLPIEQSFLFGRLAATFTSDGKYIITSGIDTKVWEL